MSDPRKKSGIDWDWIQQLIIKGFQGFGSLIEYWSMSREDRDQHARINGWIENKVERPPDELYGFERDAERRARLQAQDKEIAQGVVDKFNKLLDDYAEAHPDWERPPQFEPEWFEALKEAGTYFAEENQKLTEEYNEKLEEYNTLKEAEERAEQERLNRLEEERRQRVQERTEQIRSSGGRYTTQRHYNATVSAGITSSIALHDHPLLKTLRRLESGDDYNITLGRADIDLSTMTIDEVIAWQRRNPYENSEGTTMDHVVGAYQFKPGTLEGAMELAGIDGSTKLTPAIQDQLAWALVEMRGYEDFITGRYDAKQFTFGTYKADGNPRRDGIAWEWAVLPAGENGLSAYDSNGTDEARITWEEWINVLEECKNVDIANNFHIGFPAGPMDALSPLGQRDISNDNIHNPKPHQGTDYAIVEGTPIYAIAPGVVAEMDYQIGSDGVNGYGNMQAIVHYKTDEETGEQIPIGTTMNAHLSRYADGLEEGHQVARDQVVAYSGDTGAPGRFHLHFEVGFFVKDEEDNVQVCMVSYEDMLQFHDNLDNPQVIQHLIDRALIRQGGVVEGGVLCKWTHRINGYLPTGDQLDHIPSYDFEAAKLRLADEITASRGHRTTAFPSCSASCTHHTTDDRRSEIQQNGSSMGTRIQEAREEMEVGRYMMPWQKW